MVCREDQAGRFYEIFLRINLQRCAHMAEQCCTIQKTAAVAGWQVYFDVFFSLSFGSCALRLVQRAAAVIVVGVRGKESENRMY